MDRMRSALGGPRLLLRRLREISAESVSAQARLDKIVVQIAANMVAEVCSVYVLRADQRLELYATEGPQPRGRPSDDHARRRGPCRPHRRKRRAAGPLRGAGPPGLRLQAGDGRRNLPFLPRRADPARRQSTLGVLVVQNKVRRVYSEEEVEALQTTAMLLAETDRLGRIAGDPRPARAAGALSARCRSRARQCPTASGLAMCCCTSRASSSNSSSPKICRGSCAARTGDRRHARRRSTNWSPMAIAWARASIARCSRPCGWSPMTAAGCAACARR